jgi:hypothetical protein
MTIFTQSEQTEKKYNPTLAATAASFILETRTGMKQKLNCSPIDESPNPVTLVEINEITQRIIDRTKLIWQ